MVTIFLFIYFVFQSTFNMTRKTQKISLVIVGLLLMIPLVVMQFTKEVTWTLSDFIIMGILLLFTSFSIEYCYYRFKNTSQKIAIILGILLLFLVIWAELAVGIFNSPIAGS